MEQLNRTTSPTRDLHNTVEKGLSFFSPRTLRIQYLKPVSRLDDSRRIHDRNKYRVKRASELFLRKDIIARKINDRKVCLPTTFSLHHLPARRNSSCLLASLSTTPSLHPLTRSILVLFYLLFGYLPCMLYLYTIVVVVVILVVLPSLRFFLILIDPQPASWLRRKAHSSRGSTNSQLRSFTST